MFHEPYLSKMIGGLHNQNMFQQVFNKWEKTPTIKIIRFPMHTAIREKTFTLDVRISKKKFMGFIKIVLYISSLILTEPGSKRKNYTQSILKL